MSEKLCLQWNNFQDNVKSSFKELRKSSDFVDVTLACEDGHQIEAHRVILAASSPFFQNILEKSKHSHPLIFMRGVKSEDLVAMVDFMYNGEANVYRENLESFLVIAEDLQLKGLKGSVAEEELKEHELKEVEQHAKPAAVRSKQNYKRDEIQQNAKMPRKEGKITRDPKPQSKIEDNALAIKQLEETIKPMTKTSEDLISNAKSRQNGREEVPCKFCDKIFGSSHNKIKFKTTNGLVKHVLRYHNEN